MSSIHIENLVKVYSSSSRDNDIRAIDNLDLAVDSGEFVTIIGPSGCGKTTLLYIIAGLEKPTSGIIQVERSEVRGTRPDVGLVFQEVDRTLFPWRTATGNVEFGLEVGKRKLILLHEKERRETASRYLELVGLQGFENRYPYELSGGMRQRVAIARILAYDPRILLMDEPFANLDAQTRLILQNDLTRIWLMTKKTIVFVTHDLDEAISLGSRTIVMTARPGRVKRVLPIKFEYPRDLATRFSREFNEIKFSIAQLIEEEVVRSGGRGNPNGR